MKRAGEVRLAIEMWLPVFALMAAAVVSCSKPERSKPEQRDPPQEGSAPGTPSDPPTQESAASGSGAPATAAPSLRPENAPWARPPGLGTFDGELRKRSVAEQQDYLLRLLAAYEPAPESARVRLESIVRASELMSFGNPRVAEPALTQEACVERWRDAAPAPADPSCGHRAMVRVAPNLCIDQFEFPNVACEYPLVWVRASEAAELCGALGKRLCDAHEWEGACAGEVRGTELEYAYKRVPKGQGAEYRRARRILMEGWHNQDRELVWAYGATKNLSLCGTQSKKSPGCNAVTYGDCGTNDFPAGSFPECRTPSGVYDQHGNVAEHMSFPLYPEELHGKGYTEMKGSWFVFGQEETHPDDCRWRAKNWHTSKVSDPNSHRNYHLGFRCCADVSTE